MVPHHIGREDEDCRRAVIDNLSILKEKKDLLRLMKDLLQVIDSINATSSKTDDLSSTSKMNLESLKTVVKYKALSCYIEWMDPNMDDCKQLLDSLSIRFQEEDYRIVNVFSVRRETEHAEFTDTILNHRLLFHGSKIGSYLIPNRSLDLFFI